MLLTSWLRGWFSRADAQRHNGTLTRRRPRPHEPRRRMAPAIEPLELRQLLTGTFVVNSSDDLPDLNPGDGMAAATGGVVTLRAAIMEANALAGDQVIELPSGSYFLTLAGANEDGAVTGDLDITGPAGLTIRRTGATEAIIDAGSLDRVFDVVVGAGRLDLIDLTLRHGSLESGDGVGIRSIGRLSLDHVRVIDGTSGVANIINGGGLANEVAD